MLGLGQKVPAKYPFGPHGVRFMGSKIMYIYVRTCMYTRPDGPQRGSKTCFGHNFGQTKRFYTFRILVSEVFWGSRSFQNGFRPQRNDLDTRSGGGGAATPADPQKPPNWKKSFTKMAIKWARRGVTNCVKHINQSKNHNKDTGSVSNQFWKNFFSIFNRGFSNKLTRPPPP